MPLEKMCREAGEQDVLVARAAEVLEAKKTKNLRAAFSHTFQTGASYPNSASGQMLAEPASPRGSRSSWE